jgi:diaminohydroxyphosphoribosylaminopyrimidine deaminase/5-amino-6-(5-phosphoribosylamino)uracil reductase
MLQCYSIRVIRSNSCNPVTVHLPLFIIHHSPLVIHQTYMHRCLELAKFAAGNVAPNPMVGAVLVYEGRIIGEGYHQQYGQAHAEVNCLNSIAKEDQSLIPQSTLYVSLEPCAHFGQTPPCTDLIIKHNIPKVIIGARDPFAEVNGKGIEKLKAEGVEVELGVLEKECKQLNKRFFTFHTQNRPYIILKWAQSANGKIAGSTSGRLLISNEITNRLVHKWRSEEAAILVGTNTAIKDDPALNVRLWKDNNPIRLVVDMNLTLSSSLKLFDKKQKTIVFNTIKHEEDEMLSYYQVTADVNLVHQVLNACKQMNIQSILVEGGAKLLQSFISDGSWDEARVITNSELNVEQGLAAPILSNATQTAEEKILTDTITYFSNNANQR